MMEPLIRKTEKGWRCEKCSLDIVGMKDAETHGLFFHRVLPDFLAMDKMGNFFDTSSVDTPTLLRKLGAL